jgi:hypothetical protein
MPITKDQLIILLRENFLSGDLYDNLMDLGDPRKVKSLRVFVKRAITAEGFSSRLKSIGQKVPIDWKEKAEAGAKRVRELFFKKKVTVVINADEMFINYHLVSKSVLVPTNTARVGSAITLDAKAGCTVMVAMEMKTSTLLPPLIIFNGRFGKDLMKKWKDHKGSTVLFTENHWMTEETMAIWLQEIRLLFPGHVVGITFDHAPSHTDRLLAMTDDYNASDVNGTELVLEKIDKSLTSCYQPCDITINKPLKGLIKSIYAEDELRANLTAGDSYVVSRERLVEMIEDAHNKINDGQIKNSSIRNSFRLCGLDPYAPADDTTFERHLNSLNDNGVYAALSAQNEALKLKEVSA